MRQSPEAANAVVWYAISVPHQHQWQWLRVLPGFVTVLMESRGTGSVLKQFTCFIQLLPGCSFPTWFLHHCLFSIYLRSFSHSMIQDLSANWALGLFSCIFPKRKMHTFLGWEISWTDTVLPNCWVFKRECIMCDPFVLEAVNSLNCVKIIHLHRAVKVKLVYEY